MPLSLIKVAYSLPLSSENSNLRKRRKVRRGGGIAYHATFTFLGFVLVKGWKGLEASSFVSQDVHSSVEKAKVITCLVSWNLCLERRRNQALQQLISHLVRALLVWGQTLNFSKSIFQAISRSKYAMGSPTNACRLFTRP